MTDPIADLLTRIRNAVATKKDVVLVPHSNLKASIGQVMATNGYLNACEIIDDRGLKMLKLTLKYMGKASVITAIDRVSRPGRRVYTSSEDIKPVLGGHGISILSTNKGLMTNTEAKKLKLGGEVLCKIY